MPQRFKQTKTPEKSNDRVKLVKEFLEMHYEIKMNVFDPSKSFIVAKDKTLYKSEPSLNDISLHMESENLRGCDSILKKIINSPNQITTFNPITDYIKSLEGAWKGESHIERFCKHIIAKDFGDKEEGHYQERFKGILKKWLAASIACSLGEEANAAIIGFVNAKEGMGKTFALELLVPKELKQYYVKSNKDERFFNLTTSFTRNFVVNFDEFVGITKNNAETFKTILTSTELHISNTFTKAVPRIANGVFTSNKTQEMGGFLTSGMGTRRFAVIELEEIIKGFWKEIDIHQLWAEAYVLYTQKDFNHKWDDPDFNEFYEYNTRYFIETPAHKLINENYRFPQEGEESVFKQAKDILQDLRKARKITSAMNHVSESTIGMAMKALGFHKKMKKINKIEPRYGYEVIQLFE